MTGPAIALLAAGLAGIAAAAVLVVRLSRRGTYIVYQPGPGGRGPLLRASLVAEPRELPGRPGPVHVITDVPVAHQGARASERN